MKLGQGVEASAADPGILIGIPAWGVNEHYGWNTKVMSLAEWATNAFDPKNQGKRP